MEVNLRSISPIYNTLEVLDAQLKFLEHFVRRYGKLYIVFSPRPSHEARAASPPLDKVDTETQKTTEHPDESETG